MEIDKNITLSELERILGKEKLDLLFLEYYLTLIGKKMKGKDLSEIMELGSDKE